MRELSDDEVFGTAGPAAIKPPTLKGAAPGELSDADVFGAAPTADHWTDNLRDPLAGALKIGPTALKGVADIARLVTGDNVGVGLSNAMQEGMQSIDNTVGSERLRAQKQAVSRVLDSDEFGIGDIPGMVVDNPRAAIDAGVSTIGSMFLPTGVAAGAVRAAPTLAKVAPIIGRAAPGAIATGATIGTGAAMNAAETFADSAGGDMGDRYQGAALSGAASLALGKLFGGGAEGLVARRLAGEVGSTGAREIAKSVAKTAVKEGLQEFGEEGANTVGKQVAKDEDINLKAAAKQGAYGAVIGAGVGGASDVATNVGAARAQPPELPIDPAAPPVAEPATPRQGLGDRLDQLASRMESEGKTDQAREYRVQAQAARELERNPEAMASLLREAQENTDAPAAPDTAPAQPEATGLKPKQDGPVLQNRDRSTPSSVAQMQSIAAAPDYGRLGFSRDFANGAPVVAGGQVAPEQMGSTDVAVASDGRRIPVQYAVVEADSVLPSNTVDGATNAEYASASDRMRAIAGNGRIAGLQAAAQRGTDQTYRDELAADTLHGIAPEVVSRMRAPVLVRVMPQDQVTDNIGDVSNTSGNLQLSAVEQANNDGQRVDLSGLEFSEDGGMTAQAVRQFVQGMPQAERGSLLDTNGQPTKQAVDRLHAAVFSRAYGNDQLVRLYAQAQDPEARLILSALAKLAPKFARLEGAGALDIRSVVTEAAEIAVNARRNGTPLAQAAQQIDMAADPLVGTVLQLFARNPRSNREVIEQLGNAADMAYSEASKPSEDMFGAVPRATRDDVLNTLEPQSNERASTQSLEQPAGPGPVQADDGRPATAATTPSDGAAAQASRATNQAERASSGAGEDALSSYTPEEVTARQDAQAKAQQDQARDDREADQRAQADREVGEFTLTGSDRAADANANQGDIFSAANAEPAPPVGSSAFSRWFGNSKMVDAEGKPLVMYHGTTWGDITEFRPAQAGAIFFTDDPAFANEYTLRGMGETAAENEATMLDEGHTPTMMPVYVKAENPFDMDKAEHLSRVVDKAFEIGDVHFIGGENKIQMDDDSFWTREMLEYMLSSKELDNWQHIENEQIQKAIRASGFDSFYVMEDGRKNIGVYSPSQVKSATGNSGAFDPANPDIRYSESQGSTGNTTAAVTQALTARFGKTIAAMERRGFLTIWPSVSAYNAENAGAAIEGAPQGMYDGKAVHLFADNIHPGDEVGVFLHEAGEHASMEAMLGDRYAGLVARANELVAEGDPDALAAQDRIPADTAESARDSELVAYMIETVANKKPLTLTAKARRWLADVVAGVRAWWSQTAINRQLEKYGQGIELTPADIAALAERAVYWQSNVNGTSANAGDVATKFAKKKEAAPNPENLIVAHNLTAANILAAQELGGLAVPSLGITKANAPIEGFGDITLVGDTTLATPGAKNPIFDADVYSPRFPSVQVKVNEKAVASVLDPLREVAKAKGQRMRDEWYVLEDLKNNKIDTAVSSISYDAGARLGYASVVLGKDLAVPMKSEQVATSGTSGLMSDARFALKVGTVDLDNLQPGTAESRSLARALNNAQMRQVVAMMGDKVATHEGHAKYVAAVSRRLSMYGGDTTKDEDGIDILNDLAPGGIARLKELVKNSTPATETRSTVDFDALRNMLDREVPREQMEDWLKAQLAPAMGEKKVVKESGRTAAYTLDNVVREMARKVRDAEGFNYGLGNARSKGATKFKNLAHIQSRRDQVVPKAEFEKAREALDAEFSQLVDAVEPYKTYEREMALELLAEAIGNSYTKPLSRALGDSGLEGVPADLQVRITTFAEKLRAAPTEYFEAKPQRGVGFSEFAGAVVPKGMDPAARKVLEDAGLTLVEYDKADDGARARAVDQLSRDLHTERGNVRFSKARSTTGGNANALTQTAAAPWNVTEPGTGDAVIRAMQNNKIDLKRLRDELEKQYGQLSDKADAYMNEERYHGKVAARVEALHEEVVKPILGKIAVAGKNAGVTVDDVNLYLHSRHAAERNAAMKAINPNMANNDALSGMSDQEAASNIARLRADGKLGALQTIAVDIDNLIADTRTNLVADGLEEAAVVQAWESAYQHYVPLQRDVEGQGTGASKGMGFSVKGPEAKRAVGSNREVVNILANIVAQAETGLIRAEKTKVGRSLLELANQFPNKDFWQVDTPPTKPRINKDTGLVERNAIDPLYQTADNVVMVKDNGGEVHYIVFNDKNERGKEVARAMKNLGVEQLPWAIQQVGHGTRFIASLLTARNPLFWFTNFARDVQGVLLNLEGTEAAGLQHKVLANMPKAFKGMHSLVRGKAQGQWAQYAKEMRDAGGTTGYMQQFSNSDERMGDLRKEVARMQQGNADPRKLARTMLEFVDDYNDIVENAVRLSAYKTARDAGVSIPRAASLAKNITVNFNRKGNATPVINSLYMFFNANIQGTARMMYSIARSRRAQAIVGGIAGMGFILDMFNRMAAGEDDETGRNRYDMIPEFEKSKNWIIWNPMREGEYIKVPLPLGPHVFHNAGRLISDAINRDDPRDAAEYGWAFAGTLFDAFSPLGGAQSMAEMIAPSVVDPIIQLENNKSFTGAPVYKSGERAFGASDPNPAYTRYFESTPDVWKQASKMLNDASGGDDVKPGAINIEPDILKHIAYTFTGGPGRTIDQAIDSAQGAARGKEVTTNRMPFVSRFYGENDDKQRDRVYYDDKKRIEEAKAAFDNAMKKGRRELAKDVARELGDGDYDQGMKMLRNAKGTNREIMLINKRIKLLREREQKGDNVTREMADMQKKRTQAMNRNTRRNDDDGEAEE